MNGSFTSKEGFRRRVLVVDDEMINRRLLGHIISKEYDVLYAENGVEALKIITENVKTISLVMLDLLMPQMDGYELLAQIRLSPELKKLPVIVLTSDKSAEVKTLSMGATDFISKPYDLPEVILARVRRSIELAESYTMLTKTERDSMTGLLTREFFIEYCDRFDGFHPDMQTDVIVMNINRLHIINDLRGRGYGDSVICSVASCAQKLVGELGGLSCRSDGDTFMFYIPHCDNYGELIAKAEHCFHENAPDTDVTVRIGIYENADKSLEMERRLDRAMRASSMKKSGRKTSFSFYDTKLHEKELYNERLIAEMDEAIATKQFQVYYQPKFDIRGDKPVITSAEALIRWIHPELGFISPGAFIPAFEENGMINKLDHYVWNEASAEIRKIKENFGKTIPISVNMSRIDIFDPDLESNLLGIVSRNGITASDVLLEITESAYTNNSQHIIETVERLRSLGFRIEMDDFGTGYSSLNMLAALPIDALKLDMLFVRGMCENEKNLRMVRLVLDIAKYLGVASIAEGVETEEQYLRLKEEGCDIIQGYYFSRPLPARDFEKLIEEEKNA